MLQLSDPRPKLEQTQLNVVTCPKLPDDNNKVCGFYITMVVDIRATVCDLASIQNPPSENGGHHNLHV